MAINLYPIPDNFRLCIKYSDQNKGKQEVAQKYEQQEKGIQMRSFIAHLPSVTSNKFPKIPTTKISSKRFKRIFHLNTALDSNWTSESEAQRQQGGLFLNQPYH